MQDLTPSDALSPESGGRSVERAGAEILDDVSSDFASRDTWLFDIRSTPSCCTSFFTRRVDTPAR